MENQSGQLGLRHLHRRSLLLLEAATNLSEVSGTLGGDV